ncbi:MAG: ornithine carbamoyltransferase [Bacillota bacterium]
MPNDIATKLKGRDLLSLHDFQPGEISYILEYAHWLKEKQKKGELYRPLEGKTLGMIFLKHSTRTRVSFEVGMYQLGGYPLFLSGQDLQLGRGETIADTARVLSRYLNGIMIRTFSHQDVEELALQADIPIINGLTDLLHPCQVLADLMTIQEKKGNLAGLKLAYVGDGNNMAHSLMIGGAKMAMEVAVASPPGYKPQTEVVLRAQSDAAETGGRVTVTDDPAEAAAQADIIYTDVWTSMGQEAEREERLKVFKPYQINGKLLSQAKPDAIVLHCLPAHRGEEITDEVLEGPRSVVFDEAENRLHAQKAVLALLMG